MQQLDTLFKKYSAQENDLRDHIVSSIYQSTQSITKNSVQRSSKKTTWLDENLDNILTSRLYGFPIMLMLLGVVIYLTIVGANYPGIAITKLFAIVEDWITTVFQWANAPHWLYGVLVEGFYRGTSWVVSVMLPPMAIFFPMFALLENFGYLPRVAFNLDRVFKKSGAHGKQSLTMAMGFGCNAAAVMSSRIIESPRERMIAILTNNFVPCNGRWPLLILLAGLFMAAGFSSGMSTFVSASVVVGIVLFGIVMTIFVSWALSKTLLRGVPSHYTLELPPYRKPKVWNTIVRATLDKSWFVLKRAVIIAAPASVITWILANIFVGDQSVLQHFVGFLDPFAQAIGLDGFILMAFILGFPANEIVLPILLMGYLATGSMIEVDNLSDLKQIFLDHGWTWLTALNMMLFSLLHYPCGTTMLNIWKETKSAKWTFAAFAIPTTIAIVVTFIIAQVARGFGWV
ncbi:nucleoside recognition domain-containing protein [Virgibacillus pantothenticus]|uniref:nucleoside recognition domain-containing protein n=1 Tax=Virgibacillus pantothenticus TaxID=1473 RepID=UPI0020BF820C|nr:nucleoside recognition domain-containing protein [Virgibacillus pantothenticus]MEB5451434.1 nucleoside recognition domain-containing protein [Virgibacillus pantothenticus]MEB5455461.1 nucleoside recognition domain-containing protein [Virgibacillus pantothenticus]MEB5459612.1 nucleoside recognition domain-containing protein [Virgibacillus pantothenticus]MEB5463767.1 nucleoside recognition domain-containing protein [Virgibacillus pantothenticus]MEB5468305.1 nucleoside recognition domain-conta